MRICKLVKTFRKRLGLTQKQLSLILGVTETYLWMIEKRRKLPSKELLKTFAELTDLNPNLLIELLIRDKSYKLELRLREI